MASRMSCSVLKRFFVCAFMAMAVPAVAETSATVDPFPAFSPARRVTNGPHEHLLANYFGINAWSPDFRYLLVLETDLKHRIPEVSDPATIGLVDTADANRFIPVAKTTCWNFQEAAMGHWLSNDTFLYNDLRDGRFVTVILNWKTKAERIIPYPVSAVAPDGRHALSVNYARLRLTRPDYGYPGGGQDDREREPWPADDGLWLVDLETGKAKLIVSVASCRDQMPAIRQPGGLAYFCHTVFSRDGRHIFWLARTVDFYDKAKQIGDKGRQTTAFTCDFDGANVRRSFPDGWGGSHFNWKDGDTICVTVKINGERKRDGHIEFRVGEEEKRRQLGADILKTDGHCVYSPDGKWLSSDCYWNKDFLRQWPVLRLADGKSVNIGGFYVPPEYRAIYCRCDLHARWRPDGRQLAFNSVHEGSRQVYLIDVTPQDQQASAAEPLPALKPHPRIFADEAAFAAVKAKLATEPMIQMAARHLKLQCDRQYLKDPMPKHGITDGRRMLSTSHFVANRVLALATTYRLYGGEQYLRKAEEFMIAAAEMPDWNPSHFLDVAVMAMGVGTGYDWLYSELKPEARAIIRQGLERNGVDAGLRRKGLARGRTNWSQVCPGGVTVAALAIADEVPEKCEQVIRTVIAGMPDVMKLYQPNGAYAEGPGYWEFGTGYNVMIIAALESAYGTDFGLAAQPAFRETGYYPDLMTGPTGLRFNYADGHSERKSSWIVWWFAKHFANPGLVEPFEREAYAHDIGAMTSPLYLFNVFPSTGTPKIELPLAWRSGGSVDIAVQRSSWAKDGRFVALKGGKAMSPHGHMDAGSFVYEAKGVRWAWDLGSENYVKAERHIGMDLWHYAEGSPRFKLFRLSAAAHNTLMLDGLPHSATGDVRVVSLTSGPESEVVLDLTPLFTNATAAVRRSQMTKDGWRLADSVKGLRAGAPIKWQMMTKATAHAEGETMVLEEAGQTLRLTRQVPAGASSWTIDEAPHGADWEATNNGFRRVSFTVPSDPLGTSFQVEFNSP